LYSYNLYLMLMLCANNSASVCWWKNFRLRKSIPKWLNWMDSQMRGRLLIYQVWERVLHLIENWMFIYLMFWDFWRKSSVQNYLCDCLIENWMFIYLMFWDFWRKSSVLVWLLWGLICYELYKKMILIFNSLKIKFRDFKRSGNCFMVV